MENEKEYLSAIESLESAETHTVIGGSFMIIPGVHLWINAETSSNVCYLYFLEFREEQARG